MIISRKARWVAVLLALVLVAGMLAGCGNAAATSGAPAPTSSGEPASAAEGGQEEYVIQLLMDANQTLGRSDETPIGQVIKEKFNIVFEYLPVSADREKQNLMLATGDYPEIIRLEGSDMVKSYQDAGALVCLDDYIEGSTYFKDRYAEQIPYWRASGDDGKIYGWQSYIPNDMSARPEILDIGVRTDALEAQGWPNLLTEDDWFEFLKKALEEAPETNGQKTLGMVVPLAESWGPALLTSMAEKGGETNDQATNDAVLWNQTEQKWVETWTLPAVVDNYRFFNRLCNAGILDPDCFTDTYDQVQEKLNSGRALSVWYCVWMATGVNATLASAGMEDMQYIMQPIRSNAQAEAGLKRQIRVETTRPFDSMCITVNAKDPDRIFEMVDWLLSDEGQLLLQAGIEGTHYEIVDGKRQPTQELIDGTLSDPAYLYKQGFDLARYFGQCQEASTLDGISYDLTKDPAIYDSIFLTDREKEAFSALGWETSLDYWLETSELAPTGLASTCVLDPNSEEGKLNEKFIAWRAVAGTKLITATDFDATLAELNAEYEAMGVDRVVDKYNEILSENRARYEQYVQG